MTTLSEHFRFYNTDDADAVASDIREGKIAYTNGGKVTGTRNPAASGVHVDWSAPNNQAGPYTPNRADHLALSDDYGFAYGGTWNLYSFGLAYPGSAWALLGNYSALPAWTNYCRRYEIWGRFSASPTTAASARIRFNALDANNFCEAYVYWNGSVFQMVIDELVAGVSNQRWNVSLSSTITHPFMYHYTVDDYGDTLVGTLSGFETDTTADEGAVTATYYSASRPNKSVTTTQFGVRSVGDASCLIKGYRVIDI